MSMRTVGKVVGLLLAAWLLVACGGRADLGQAQMTVSLLTPLERNLVRDQQLLTKVEVTDAAGAGVKGLKVTAELYDASGQSVQTLICQPVAEAHGRYESAVFVPPAGAQAGDWRVQAVAAQGAETISQTITVRVEDTLGAQMVARHAFYLPIPPDWRIVEQTSTAQGGRLLLDPMAADPHKALFDLRYLPGNVGVSQEALRQDALAYAPDGFSDAQAYVQQVIPMTIQGSEGLLARGGLVARQGNHDYNLNMQVYRLYCAAADRTYTIVALADAAETMSRMAALLDALQCAAQ